MTVTLPVSVQYRLGMMEQPSRAALNIPDWYWTHTVLASTVCMSNH